MKKSIAGLLILMMWIVYPSVSEATVTVYENYTTAETEFDAEVAAQGLLPLETINFNDLTINDIITTQFESQNVNFSTNPGYSITAKTSAWGTDALDEYPNGNEDSLCAVLDNKTPERPFFELQFNQPVWGVSLWVLDVHQGGDGGINVAAYNSLGEELGLVDSEDQELPFPYRIAGSSSTYTYIGMLSDEQDIACVRVTTIYKNNEGEFDDGIGFDDVTVVPELATFLLLGLGGLMLRRKRRR